GLDMVATWPSMYPDDYTSQTELEQTRVIFSDLVGQDQSRNGNVTIRNILDNTTSYQHGTIDFNSIFYFPDELQKVQTRVYSYNHGSYCGDCYCWPYGVILNYPSNTYRYGDNDPGTSGDHWQNAPITNINAATQHTTYVDGENMWGDVSSFSGCNLPGYCSGDCSPGGSCPSNNGYFQSCNSQLPNQKINALYPFTQTNVSGASGKLGVMASFVPYGLSPNN
ncbi:insecticidal delta-endotoxin, partial [Bacillus sp. SRB3LM]